MDGRNLTIYLDSGAAVSTLNKETYQKFFAHKQLKSDGVWLRAYNKQLFRPMGYIVVKLEYMKVNKPIKFYVIERAGPNIVGRDWCKAFKVEFTVGEVGAITAVEEMENLTSEF